MKKIWAFLSGLFSKAVSPFFSALLETFGPGIGTELHQAAQHALLECALQGQEEDMQQLLSQLEIHVDFQDKLGKTPLHWLVGRGNPELVRMFLPHVQTARRDLNGATALHEAVSGKHTKVVECLLESQVFQAAINARDYGGRTALHWAAVHGQHEIVQKLIGKGATFRMAYEGEVTALHLAIHRRLSETTQTLLRHWGGEGVEKIVLSLRETDSVRKNEQSLLLWAVKEGITALAEILLKNGDPGINGTADSSQKPPLYFAVKTHRMDMVKLLIDHGAELDTRCMDHKMTPLLFATLLGDAELVRLLLDKGAKTEQVNDCCCCRTFSTAVAKESDDCYCRRTPLSAAVVRENAAMVKLLLSGGADIEARDSQQMTPLHLAVRNKNDGLVDILVGNGADIEARDSEKMTPLLLAVQDENEVIVDMLMRNGANVEAQGVFSKEMEVEAQREAVKPLTVDVSDAGIDRRGEGKEIIEAKAEKQGVPGMKAEKPAPTDLYSGYTALIYACCLGNLSLVKLLLDHGADIEAVDGRGRTPLLMAARRPAFDVMELLIDRGADVRARDIFGSTALCFVVKHGGTEAVDIARRLLGRGVDVNAVVDGDLGALALAKGDMAELLLSFGATKALSWEIRESSIGSGWLTAESSAELTNNKEYEGVF